VSYLAVVFVIIITPGISVVMRTILSLLSICMGSLAITIPAFSVFIAVKDPNSSKAFWNKIWSAVNQNIARGQNAAESPSTREV
jgi:phage-related minor tail protein